LGISHQAVPPVGCRAPDTPTLRLAVAATALDDPDGSWGKAQPVGASDVLPALALASGDRHHDDAPQPDADDRRRAVPGLCLRRRPARAVRVFVRQRQRPRAVVALPLVVVREAVVLPERPLLLGRQLALGIDTRGILDLLLLQSDADLVVLRELGVVDRYERLLAPEQPRLHRRPRGLTCLTIKEDVLDRADLVAVRVNHLHAAPCLHVL